MAWTKTRTCTKIAIGAGVLLALSAGFVAAESARTVTNVNLRQGPGTSYGVITTIPAGTVVDVVQCTGEWCNVHWRERGGYAVARNLDLRGGPTGGPVPGGPPGPPGSGPVAGPYPAGPYYGPPVVIAEPYPYYGPYYGPYWGPRWGGRWRRW